MKMIDGYLSRLAQQVWPDAIVYRDVYVEPVPLDPVHEWIRRATLWISDVLQNEKIDREDGNEIQTQGFDLYEELRVDEHDPKFCKYMLERLDEEEEEIGLGTTFKEARAAVQALRRQKEGSHGPAKG